MDKASIKSKKHRRGKKHRTNLTISETLHKQAEELRDHGYTYADLVAFGIITAKQLVKNKERLASSRSLLCIYMSQMKNGTGSVRPRFYATGERLKNGRDIYVKDFTMIAANRGVFTYYTSPNERRAKKHTAWLEDINPVLLEILQRRFSE